MPERSHKRKLRSDQTTSHSDEEVTSFTNDENLQLSERDFEDISNKIENKISKRLRDAELGQQEILRLIENLSAKVDSLSGVTSEQGYLTAMTENNENSTEDLEEVDLTRNASSNTRQLNLETHSVGSLFTGALLTGALLSGALLTGAVLTGAVLTGALLTGVPLSVILGGFDWGAFVW